MDEHIKLAIPGNESILICMNSITHTREQVMKSTQVDFSTHHSSGDSIVRMVVNETIESNLGLGVEAISGYDGMLNYVVIARHNDNISIELDDIPAFIQAIKAAQQCLQNIKHK